MNECLFYRVLLLQHMSNACGLRSWFQLVRMPGVTCVKVWSWASDDNDKVPDSILRLACSQAKVEYMWGTKHITK